MALSFRFKQKTQEAKKSSSNTTFDKNYRNFIVKAVGLISSQGAQRGDFVEPEYPLEEIKRAADADSYIKMSLMKYSYLIYKAGYMLKSENDEAVDYLKTRFKVMGYVTKKPMDILFQEVADDIVKYSNAFLVKSRVDSIGFGVKAKGVTNDKPIGGYFRMDPTYIRIKRDKHGTIQKYEQFTDSGDTKEFAPSEVIHIYMDKDASNSFGTPRIIAALEDVKLLRRIEGNVVSLIYRFAMPIYQWMIGLPQAGMQATRSEIEDAQREVENMQMDGIVFTNERTQIKAIGAEGNALDASGYLAYFEQRVFSALGVSEAQMGRGGAKQDADSMEAQIHDTVKHIQQVLKIFIENMIINELLMEGGYNPIIKASDEVHYEFNEISLETKVKLENNILSKFQSNVVTFSEARTAMGMTNEANEEELYAHMITKKIAMEQQEQKTADAIKVSDRNNQNAIKLAKANAQINASNNEETTPQTTKSTATGKKGNTDSKVTAKPNKDVSNKNMPENQYGKTSVKIKEDMEITEASKKDVAKHKKSYSQIYKRYEMLRNDISEENADIDVLIPLTKDGMVADIKTLIQMESYEGIAKATKELSSSSSYRLIPNVQVSLTALNEEAEKTIEHILRDVKKRLVAIDHTDSVQVSAIFDALEYRIRFLLEFILPKAYWYAYIKAGAELGADKAYIIFNSEADAADHENEIDTKNFRMEDIPAYHSFCDCKVTFKKGGEK